MIVMKKRIFLVDDDASVTSAVRRNLEATGRFDVMDINNPEHAIDKARKFEPDMVILDVMMPEMDGGAVAEAIADDSILADVPIIFLTGIVSKEEVEPSGTKRGKHIFFAKPVKFEELLACIDEQLRTSG
jgi:DNA-binding response OmpR family regulator